MEIATHYLSLFDSTIPMISGSGLLSVEIFLSRWNEITVRKGREKGQFLGISYFWIDVLGLLPYEGTTFIPTFHVKARLYVNFIALRKYNFLDYFLFCFVYKIFAVTIRNITP